MRYEELVDILNCRCVCKILRMTNNWFLLYILCEKCHLEWCCCLGYR